MRLGELRGIFNACSERAGLTPDARSQYIRGMGNIGNNVLMIDPEIIYVLGENNVMGEWKNPTRSPEKIRINKQYHVYIIIHMASSPRALHYVLLASNCKRCKSYNPPILTIFVAAWYISLVSEPGRSKPLRQCCCENSTMSFRTSSYHNTSLPYLRSIFPCKYLETYTISLKRSCVDELSSKKCIRQRAHSLTTAKLVPRVFRFVASG